MGSCEDVIARCHPSENRDGTVSILYCRRSKIEKDKGWVRIGESVNLRCV